MKKQFLLLAGSAILLASCGGNQPKNEGQTKEQIDSAVNAQVAAKEAAMKAQNDSMIAAQAKAKADSEMIAKDAVAKDHSAHASTTKRHTETKAATPPPPPPPPPPINQRPGSDKGGAKNINDRPGAH